MKDTKKKELYNFDYQDKKNKTPINKSVSNKQKIKSKKLGQAQKSKNFGNEIIIGVTEYPKEKDIERIKKINNKVVKNKKKIDSKKQKEEIKKNEKEKENRKKARKLKKKQENIEAEKRKKILKELKEKEIKNNTVEINISNEEEEKKKQKKKEKTRKKAMIFLKVFVAIIIVVGGSCFALMSPLFNIEKIVVEGNQKITSQEIISISKIKTNTNIFQTSKIQTINNIKENAYIDNVSIERNLPNKITIKITERTTTFLLTYGSGYVYIDNQGYELEISSNKLDLPILTGLKTNQSEYKVGDRLDTEDLVKLDTVIKIMDSAKVNSIDNLISSINIANEEEYILTMESQNKQVYLGKADNLETRMPILKKILSKEEGSAGIVFINMDVNNENPYFRENV